MKINTKNKILKLLNRHDYTVTELAKKLELSKQIIHRHLNDLQDNNKIGKKGKMPKVFYFKKNIEESRVLESRKFFEEKILPVFLRKNKSSKKNFLGLLLNKKENEKINFDFLLTASALYSSNIEGNTLDLNSFLNKETLSKKRKKEVFEIDDLKMAYIHAGKYQLSEKNFLEVHEILSKSLVSKSRQGCYRQEAVGVFGSFGLTYLAIEAELVSSEMSLLFEQITQILAKKMIKQEVFFWAMWLHLMLALIHPFSDGNGRAARIIEKWFLVQRLGQEYWFLQTEKYYWDNLAQYYEDLNLGPNYWEVNFRKANKFFK